MNSIFAGVLKDGKFVPFSEINKYGYIVAYRVFRPASSTGVHSKSKVEAYNFVQCTKEYPDMQSSSFLYS